MDIKKFNDEEMVFKADVMFKNGDSVIIYFTERTMAMLIDDDWGGPFIAYTDHNDIYIRRVDDIQSIYIESESTLTETEYVKMLDTLGKDNLSRLKCETVKVITDENEIGESVKFALERLKR